MKLFDVYPLYDITPVKGEGMYVFDENGIKYLDLYGGHAVISIGHSHPTYISNLHRQLKNLGFYSNAIKNPLQNQLAEKLGALSQCEDYQLFLCNSGAEANENALKLASFVTNRSRVIAFKNAFHGRTSAAVATTDNPAINAPINQQQEVTFLPLGDLQALEKELSKEDVCAVIIEYIQGVGGLDETTKDFYEEMNCLCHKHGTLLIADEVQAGFGRTGDFFAFQKYTVIPDIISMAKGMGNGFPVGGILIHPHIKPKFGMLGTTFGGNHLACMASLSVLEVLAEERLMENAVKMEAYFKQKAKKIPQVKKIKGRGLMLGLEFNFEVAELRKKLIYEHHIFTGSASNKKVLRILPPLCIETQHLDVFFNALKIALL